MNRRPVLVIAGLVLVAFGLGVRLGMRFREKPRNGTMTAAAAPLPGAVDAPAANSGPCADFRNAAPLVGKSGCVTGLVLRVYPARTGNTFLDFCQDYRTCPFTSIIFAADKGKFGNLEALQGKRVEIRGDVVTYQGHAEIVIHDPQQLR